MATTTLTNVQALTLAIELATASGNTELVEKLTKMLATASKPRKKSNVPSETQLKNLELAKDVLAYMQGRDGVTAKDISNNVANIATSQKAVAIMRILINDGKVIKGKVGSQTVYTLA
jgi:hypothetical protein